jgi:hypothetical protein
MEFVFETTDHEGTPVVLSQATWQAKAGNDEPGTHPEIRSYLADVQTTIEAPNLVFGSTQDKRSRILYRLYAGHGDFAGRHLVVVVKYVYEATGQRGYVSTMYLSRSVYSRGALLWTNLENW